MLTGLKVEKGLISLILITVILCLTINADALMLFFDSRGVSPDNREPAEVPSGLVLISEYKSKNNNVDKTGEEIIDEIFA